MENEIHLKQIISSLPSQKSNRNVVVKEFNSLCDAINSMGGKEACCKPVVKKSTDTVWQIIIWTILLLIIPATLIPIINYSAGSEGLSTAEFAIEIIILILGLILFTCALFALFWKPCSKKNKSSTKETDNTFTVDYNEDML